MSKILPNVTKTIDDYPSPLEEPVPEKQKLNWSHSENTLNSYKDEKHKSLSKILSKVRSWSSSNDSQIKERDISVDLDLVRSLTKLEVLQSNENLAGIHLLRARDSLDNLVNDEQNMPNFNLEQSIVQQKSRNLSDSQKSSPQLGGSYKADSSKMICCDPYDRQGKKNRKDNKRNDKGKNPDSPRSNGSVAVPSKQHSALKKEASYDTTEKLYYLEAEKGSPKYKFLATKNSKSVEFTNEALVIYFNNDDVIGEEKEPLKKEVEQQTRNKEMRQFHLNKTQEKYNLCLF